VGCGHPLDTRHAIGTARSLGSCSLARGGTSRSGKTAGGWDAKWKEGELEGVGCGRPLDTRDDIALLWLKLAIFVRRL